MDAERPAIILRVLLFVLLTVAAATEAATVEFTFTPSLNIELGDEAIYQCLVNDTRLSITWNINGSGAIPHGITVTGVTPNSTLTIPGEVQYNNTMVRCIVSGFIDGTNYANSSDSTLLIQGQLGQPSGLSCVIDDSFVWLYCNWTSPFSLTDVTMYVVNITISDQTSVQLVTNITDLSYNLRYYGNYTISVAGENKVGEGNKTSIHINQRTVTVELTSSEVNEAQQWIMKFTTMNAPGPIVGRELSFGVSLNNNQKYSNGTGRFQKGGTLVGSVNMGVLEGKHWNVTVSLIYPNGIVNITDSIPFSSFHVQNGSMEVNSSTSNVCFTAYFIQGSNSNGCYIEYNCTEMRFNGGLYISRPASENVVSRCASLNVSIYDVFFYDGEDSGDPEDIAFKLFNQSVQAVPSDTSTATVINISPTTSSFNTIVSPSVSPVDDDIAGDEQNVVIIISISGTFVVAVLIALIVLVAIIFLKRNSSANKNNITHPPSAIQELQVTVTKYTPVEFPNNGPNPGLEMHSKVVYSDVIPGMTTEYYYESETTTEQEDEAPRDHRCRDMVFSKSYEQQQQGQTTDLSSTSVPSDRPLLSEHDIEYHRNDGYSIDAVTVSNCSHHDMYDQLHRPETKQVMKPKEDTYDVLNRNNGGQQAAPRPQVYDVAYPNASDDDKKIATSAALGGYSTIVPNMPPADNFVFKTNKTELTHADLTSLVVPHVSTKWYEVGLALAITPDVLDEMRENRQGISDVFTEWEEGKTRPFNWDTLIAILKSHTVNEPQLAMELEGELK